MYSQEKINELVSQVKEASQPDKIYLFGSYASGKATETSDLDLLVVDNSSREKNKLALEISNLLFPREYGLELIVASSDEIKKKQAQNFGFWIDIIKTGKKIYERN